MRKAYDGMILAVQAISAVLCLVMLAVVVVGVVYRYVLDDSLAWYDEFAGYLLVWLTMFGSVVALAKRKHIGFETLVEKLPLRARRGAEVFGLLCVLSFALVLVLSGWQLIREMGAETAISIPWVKMAWVYGVMPVAGALMALVCLVQLAQAVRAARPPAVVAPSAPPSVAAAPVEKVR